MEKKKQFAQFYLGLRESNLDEFPKGCKTCKKTFQTLDDFLNETVEIPASTGLIEVEVFPESPVGLWRNCLCGSTLLVLCDDRRDPSEEAARQRRIFSKCLN